jgi:hypothetical protein
MNQHLRAAYITHVGVCTVSRRGLKASSHRLADGAGADSLGSKQRPGDRRPPDDLAHGLGGQPKQRGGARNPRANAEPAAVRQYDAMEDWRTPGRLHPV